jgi:uncharacterized protein (UPF0264 family)
MNAAEASAALAGGADLIDAKNPVTGPLGAVSADDLRDICSAVGGTRTVTAALGDAFNESMIERAACAFAIAGAALVKVGFGGLASANHIDRLIVAAVRGALTGSRGTCGVVAVAYADADAGTSLAPTLLTSIAAHAGARGVLLDTADKHGPGVCALVTPHALGSWAAGAHDHGLFVALAGKLMAADLPFVRDCGADIAGVRGAACEGGRTGRVTAERVRLLRVACRSSQVGDEASRARLALVSS